MHDAPPRCPTCDHDLRGVREMTCPECGNGFIWLPAGSKPPMPTHLRRRIWLAGALIMVLTIAGCAVITFVHCQPSWGTQRVEFAELMSAYYMTGFLAGLAGLTMLSPVTAGLVIGNILCVRAAFRNRRWWIAPILSYVLTALYVLILTHFSAAFSGGL